MSTMSSSWLARLVALSTLTLATLPRPATAQAPAPRASTGASTGASAAVADTLQRIYQRFLDGLRLRDTTMYRDLLATNYVHVFGDTAAVTVGRAARIAWDRERSGTITDFHVARCDVQRVATHYLLASIRAGTRTAARTPAGASTGRASRS